MGLFKTPEEKAQSAQAKLDAMEEKKLDQLRKKGLDLANYSDAKLKKQIEKSMIEANSRMAGTGVYQTATMLPGGNADAGMIMSLLKAQIDQNWIMIRQNELIIRRLDEIASNTEGLELAEEE